MDRWMDKLMDGWTDLWMGGWMGVWIDEWMNGWVGGCSYREMDGCVDGWMDLWIDRFIDGWVGGWVCVSIYGWMPWIHLWMHGWMDGWFDRWLCWLIDWSEMKLQCIYIYILSSIVKFRPSDSLQSEVGLCFSPISCRSTIISTSNQTHHSLKLLNRCAIHACYT